MKENKIMMYKIGKFILKWGYLKPFYNPKIEGLDNIPNDKAVVLAGNHKSNLDPILVCCFTKRKVNFLAKKELYKNKILSKFLLNVGTIPIDREISSDINAIKNTLKKLKNNEVIGVFPEGKRNTSDKLLLPLKSGTVSLAKRGKGVLIPFAITGEYKLFRNNLTLRFGEPINYQAIDEENENLELEKSIKKLIKINE